MLQALKNLFMKELVKCSVLVDVKCLLVPKVFNVDGFSWVEAESLTKLLHLVIEKIDLFFTAIDALGIVHHLPDTVTTNRCNITFVSNEYINNLDL